MLAALERRPLWTRLVIGFGGALLISLVIGLQSGSNLRALRDEARQVYDKELLGISHLKEANVNLVLIGRALRRMILAPDAASRDNAHRDIVIADTVLRREITEARKAAFRTENIERLDAFEKHYAQYALAVQQAIALLEKEGYASGVAASFVSSPAFTKDADMADALLRDVA